MTDGDAWFEGIDPDDPEAGAQRVREGRADAPGDWPTVAVERGAFDDSDAYYDALTAATTTATERAVRERERADDRQLAHAIRALDDVERVANELAERVDEWAGSLGLGEGDPTERARAVAADNTGSETRAERRARTLAERTTDFLEERDRLRGYVERAAPAVAPNLSALAGPMLAARLVALAGDLESLAKMPSGTVQVLGAEDALFAHLQGGAPSPKHGVIFTHEYVRGTHPDHRGSAARALAGKLSIAARIDHYSGDRRPELERDLDERIERIRARTGDGGDDPEGGDDDA